MSANKNRSMPSLDGVSKVPTSDYLRGKAASIFERPVTSDKPLLSLSTAVSRSRSKSPNRQITPSTPVSAVRTDSPSRSLIQNDALPQFLNLPAKMLASKFALLREHERVLRTMPNTLKFHPVVQSRNRYSDVYPWEHHRIHLSSLQFGYINASPISLNSGGIEENYIATQGPRDNGRDGNLFWEMCWQEKTEVIVMLTKPVESGMEKCGVYYAERVGEVKRMGEWEIECVGREYERGTIKRTLKLRRVPRMRSPLPSPTSSSSSSRSSASDDEKFIEAQVIESKSEEKEEEEAIVEERIIQHFLFLNWPDNDIPQSPEDIQSLVTLLGVSRIANKSSATPRIIHCSAGVGRTGTFIALDHLSRELEQGYLDNLEKDDDPIFETVKKLRDQRMLMVHRISQFLMIYSVMKEKWVEREKSRGTICLDGTSKESSRLALTPCKSKNNEQGEEIDKATSSSSSLSSSARKRKLIGEEDDAGGGLLKVVHT